MDKKKWIKKGSISYKVLLLSVIFIFLTVSVLTPFFLIEGGNRTLGYSLAIAIGIIYILFLTYYLYEWMKAGPSEKHDE